MTSIDAPGNRLTVELKESLQKPHSPARHRPFSQDIATLFL